VVYVALTLGISFAFEAWMIRSAGGLRALDGKAVVILMWTPGIVSLLVRLFGGEGFADMGVRLGPGRYWAWAYVAPLVLAAFTYGASYAVGAVSFAPRPSGLQIESPVARWLMLAAISATLGVAISSLYALGEEIGWRGYLITRLVEAKIPAPLVTGGLIWGVWHLPMILWGDYATSGRPWLSALLFMACITLAGLFFGWLRLAGGSMWTAMIAHASHNVFYQGVFDANFEGKLEPYLAGEQGLFSIIGYGALAVWLWKTGRLRRATEAQAAAA
jgi:membrane protease YdiL (CAAX protease family)